MSADCPVCGEVGCVSSLEGQDYCTECGSVLHVPNLPLVENVEQVIKSIRGDDRVKKVLRVFPDYMSSALWNETGEVDVNDYNISPITKVALKYWNDVWEGWEIDLHLTTPDRGWITHYYKEWWEDGRAIAQDIQKSNPDVDVIYMADTPEEIEQLYYGEGK